MKTKHIITLLLALFSLSASPQGGRLLKEKREQLKPVKVAFITDALSLTAVEAEKFWPVYNKFEDKQFDLRQEKMETYKKRSEEGALDKMSDKEASALLSQMETAEDELHQLRKKLVADLKGIIPAAKIIKLKKAEEDFNRKLLKQYRNKKN